MPRASILTASYASLRTSAVATGIVFALSGATSATWISRLPEIRNHLHADTGSLGVALLGSAIGAICSTPLTGPLVRRYSSRVVVLATTIIANLALIALSLAPSVWALGVTLLFFGFGYGAWDVSMNVHGHAVESHADKPWMPRYHALWSVGGFVFAGLGALASHLGVPITAHFVVAAAINIGGVAICLHYFFDDRDAAEEEERLHRESSGVAMSRAVLARALIPLGIVMACATLIEGAASDWLGIYFNTERDLSPAAGSAAYTIFAVAMAISRGIGTWTIEKLGRGLAVRVSAIVSFGGVALLLLSPVVALSYVGAALWGLGIALIFPAVVSAAGDTPGQSAQAISLVTPVGYSGFLFGPPAIGLLARHVGLGNALWVVGGLAAIAAMLAGSTRDAHEKARHEHEEPVPSVT